MANPPFQHPARNQQNVAQSATTASAAPTGPFEGGRQPYAPRKLLPSLLSVDSPPAYAWELLVLPPEDPTVYFRAQRWPQNKTIVSVDNPTAQDDERAAVAEVILNIWNAPIQPLPQQPKKIAAISVVATTSTADWFSTGVGAATFTGAAADIADWLSAGVSVATFNGVAADTAAWNAVGASTAQFVGTAADVAAWSATGTATAVWNEASFANTDWNSAGIGLASWNSPSSGAADWVSTGIATATWTQQSDSTASWSSAGSSTASFVSAATPARVANRDGYRLRAQLERRRRKDEDEIMALAKAVLPLLRRGIRQPTRIHL